MKKRFTSLKLFNILAKRAYAYSKRNKLGWKWRDAQRFTSKNLYQEFKDIKTLSSLDKKEVDRLINVRSKFPVQIPAAPVPGVAKPKEICKNPKDYPTSFFDDFDWFDIDEKLSVFDNDMYMQLALEVNGTDIAFTPEVKKRDLPNLVDIREEIRKQVPTSPVLQITMNILVREGHEDDDKPCSYFVLVAFEDSVVLSLMSSRFASVVFKPKQAMSPEELEKIRLAQEEAQKQKKEQQSKKTIKAMPRPTLVEPKPLVQKSAEELKNERLIEYNKAIKELKKLVKEGLITPKQFSKRFDELGRNLKLGGII